MQLEAPEEHKELTPEEQLADKLRLKKLQEESDLELAKETFGECVLCHGRAVSCVQACRALLGCKEPGGFCTEGLV